jgi:hypothetical protein
MANSLLDFVMSIVRDPDAAARYAADPEKAIADANLADVTSVDVSNLIPVVSESLSMSLPATGADGVLGEMADNVWASGAATAAFDAFDDHVPTIATDLVDEPEPALQSGLDILDDTGVPDAAGVHNASLQFDDLAIDETPTIHTDDLDHTIEDVPPLGADDSGFDVL